MKQLNEAFRPSPSVLYRLRNPSSVSVEPSSRRPLQASPEVDGPVYTPCLDGECINLLEEYERSGDPDIAEHLLDSLDAARKRRWEEPTAQMDFTHSSRRAWSLIRRLGAAQQPPTYGRSCVTANQVASHMIKTGKSPVDRTWKRAGPRRVAPTQICLRSQHQNRPVLLGGSDGGSIAH